MDDKGFIVTSDALLSLIVVFILLATVTNINADKSVSSMQDMVMAKKVQDTMELMANYKDISTNKTLIDLMVEELEKNSNQKSGIDNAGQIAGEFLNKTLIGYKYNLIEVNKLNGTTLASNANINQANNISVASRSCAGYTFKLYAWNN